MDIQFAKVSVTALVLLSVTGCGQRDDLAPVTELNWRSAHSRPAKYVVMRGDTLYAIAFRYDKDYRELAEANHIYSPYSLRVGQVIQIQSGYQPIPSQPKLKTSKPTWADNRTYAQKKTIKQTTDMRPTPSWRIGRTSRWLWPAHGRVVAYFVPTAGKKGLDISGAKGDKIYAASNGTVAYAGSGLAGYGNLIIIKHDNQFLTAYGNNARNLVSEGQTIRAGQVIAEMGVVDRQYWGVHFEIRQAGKPVNPLNYLQGRQSFPPIHKTA